MYETTGTRFLPLLLALLISTTAAPTTASVDYESKLNDGHVVINHDVNDGIEFVVGKIRIKDSPSKVWKVLVNPYEFESISGRMKVEAILDDKDDSSLMKCRIDPGMFLPPIRYTVESKYDHGRRITFKSRGGDLKDFRGEWVVTAGPTPLETDVSYAMYVSPNLPIPQWLVRQGVKFELPRTLGAFRKRVYEISAGRRLPEAKNIFAGKVQLRPIL
jgi:hypothetical protein